MGFCAKMFNMIDEEKKALLQDTGLLVLRLGIGLTMAFSHGLGKVSKLFGPDPIQFADPIGLGPAFSLFLAGSAEFFASLLIAVGLLTRMAAVPLAFTMLVAVAIVHADDPWGKKEFAFIYLIPALTLALTGPGRFSVDAWLKNRCGSCCDEK